MHKVNMCLSTNIEIRLDQITINKNVKEQSEWYQFSHINADT